MTSLYIPAFIAGLFTFLAPCTLPLVPGYLGFISGISAKDLLNPSLQVRKRILINSLMYIVGFSVVFIALGLLFGVAGSVLGAHRLVIARIGGVFIIFFGLYLMHVFDLHIFSFLSRDHRFNFLNTLRPGKPYSSLIFGATFAFGWTPCVGPILGSILLLSTTSDSFFQAGLLLFIFSLGLAVPFFFIALSVSKALHYIKRLSKYLPIISFVGGLFLVFLGILLLTNNLEIWFFYVYKIFNFVNYDRIIDFL